MYIIRIFARALVAVSATPHPPFYNINIFIFPRVSHVHTDMARFPRTELCQCRNRSKCEVYTFIPFIFINFTHA